MKPVLRILAVFLVLLSARAALAEADGPDYFRLRVDGTVGLYEDLTPDAKRLGTLPVAAEGLRNLGCKGLPTYAQWSAMSAEARQAAAENAWCRVDFLGQGGWVRHAYLGEGAPPQSPGFDCAEASGQVETMICEDPALILLDRQMNAAFKLAVEAASSLDERPADAVSLLRARQRGWIKGRNDCWKSQDVASCVKDGTERRLSILHVEWNLVPPAKQRSYRCGENAAIVLSYYDLLPRNAIAVEYGDRWAVFVAGDSRNKGRFEGSFGRWVELDGSQALLKLDQKKPTWQCEGI
ncbi:lysozyme inhibitor LprI family protein [Aestuariispira ectoiniformans]|uniref:lysozyme inhibitor LprI family protein n=1 Tax=Aestuariispira ectoiniformans TaxID=2775080 RepID=UPI00223BCEFB|nr:lysozyme inhibitor LprI family protein [Aestuariispira ectoiniformans]